MYSAACGERLRQLDMKYPKDSKFLSKIKLRVADKFKRDIDDIVEEVVQVNEAHMVWNFCLCCRDFSTISQDIE